MQAFCVDKLNASACSGRRRPRRSESKAAPAAEGGQKALVTSFIKAIFKPIPEQNLKPRAPLRQNPGAESEAGLPPLNSPGRPARRAGTAVADKWVL